MSSDVADHIRACHECTLAKPPLRALAQPVGPKVGEYLFDIVYCDILSMAPTHDHVKGKAGFDKLIVFVDSLTRWIEAQPVSGDPSANDVFDIILTLVVSRHGLPRQVRTDAGSNLTARLCQIIPEKTGTALSSTKAYRHEGVGLVERAQQTLIAMVRTSNDGGGHWVDHLPFLLMAMRAAAGRVTKMSPAALLYGRELRLPAQLVDLRTSSSIIYDGNVGDIPTHYREYAEKLNSHFSIARQTALEATHLAQMDSVRDSVRRSNTDIKFKVGDRVCRPMSGHSNKLQFFFSGPYRVLEVLSDSQYRLRDLENRIAKDEVHISNLQPYLTITDEVELEEDEYIVEELINRRGTKSKREYLVKWRGNPRGESTWEPVLELQRRCADLVEDYDLRKGPKQPNTS
jgi:hypothetical protein